MRKTICIVNQREGAGKTTTAVNIATALALYEKKTLLIDCDPQSRLTRCFAASVQAVHKTLFHGFMGKASGDDLAVSTDIRYLSIIPCQPNLFLTEHRLAVKPGKELLLKKMIQRMDESFEFVIIDAPSSLGFFAVCAMAAAESAIVPFTKNLSAADDLVHLKEVFQIVQQQLNPDLQTVSLLFHKFASREEGLKGLPEGPFQTGAYQALQAVIPNDPMVQHAYGDNRPSLLTDIMAPGSQCFLSAAEELLNGWDG